MERRGGKFVFDLQNITSRLNQKTRTAVLVLERIAAGELINLQNLREILAKVPQSTKTRACNKALEIATRRQQEDIWHILDQAGAISKPKIQVQIQGNLWKNVTDTWLDAVSGLSHNTLNVQLRETASADTVALLLDAGAQPNYYGKYGSTPVHEAAYCGRPDCLALLLKHKGLATALTAERRTPLHSAAIGGNKECVEILLKAGVDVKAQDYCSMTALHYAVGSARSVDCVPILLEAGANVNAKNSFDMTPLHCAAAYGTEETVKILLKAGATLLVMDRWGRIPANMVYGECATPQRKQARASLYRLLNEGGGWNDDDEECTNEDFIWDEEDCFRDGAKLLRSVKMMRRLIASKQKPKIDSLKNLVSLHPQLMTSYTCCKALQTCAKEGKFNYLLLFLELGANPNAKESDFWMDDVYEPLFPISDNLDANEDWITGDHDNWTLLHLAADGGHIQTVELLEHAGASLERVWVYDHLEPFGPLEAAAASGHLIIVKMLLVYGCVADREQLNGALRLALTPEGSQHDQDDWDKAPREKVARTLLDAGADPNAQDVFGHTAIMGAASAGLTTCVALLAHRGGNISAQEHNGRSALHVAALGGHAECVSFLIGAGANVSLKDSMGSTPLHYVAKGRTDGKWAFTPSKRSGDAKTVLALLAGGAEVDAADDSGLTPLHRAAASLGSQEVVEELVKAGACINAKDRIGKTPLHYAASAGVDKVVQYLLTAGADPNATDQIGHTPRSVAKQSVVQLLRCESQGEEIEDDCKSNDSKTSLLFDLSDSNSLCSEEENESDDDVITVDEVSSDEYECGEGEFHEWIQKEGKCNVGVDLDDIKKICEPEENIECTEQLTENEPTLLDDSRRYFSSYYCQKQKECVENQQDLPDGEVRIENILNVRLRSDAREMRQRMQNGCNDESSEEEILKLHEQEEYKEQSVSQNPGQRQSQVDEQNRESRVDSEKLGEKHDNSEEKQFVSNQSSGDSDRFCQIILEKLNFAQKLRKTNEEQTDINTVEEPSSECRGFVKSNDVSSRLEGDTGRSNGEDMIDRQDDEGQGNIFVTRTWEKEDSQDVDGWRFVGHNSRDGITRHERSQVKAMNMIYENRAGYYSENRAECGSEMESINLFIQIGNEKQQSVSGTAGKRNEIGEQQTSCDRYGQCQQNEQVTYQNDSEILEAIRHALYCPNSDVYKACDQFERHYLNEYSRTDENHRFEVPIESCRSKDESHDRHSENEGREISSIHDRPQCHTQEDMRGRCSEWDRQSNPSTHNRRDSSERQDQLNRTDSQRTHRHYGYEKHNIHSERGNSWEKQDCSDMSSRERRYGIHDYDGHPGKEERYEHHGRSSEHDRLHCPQSSYREHDCDEADKSDRKTRYKTHDHHHREGRHEYHERSSEHTRLRSPHSSTREQDYDETDKPNRERRCEIHYRDGHHGREERCECQERSGEHERLCIPHSSSREQDYDETDKSNTERRCETHDRDGHHRREERYVYHERSGEHMILRSSHSSSREQHYNETDKSNTERRYETHDHDGHHVKKKRYEYHGRSSEHKRCSPYSSSSEHDETEKSYKSYRERRYETHYHDGHHGVEERYEFHERSSKHKRLRSPHSSSREQDDETDKSSRKSRCEANDYDGHSGGEERYVYRWRSSELNILHSPHSNSRKQEYDIPRSCGKRSLEQERDWPHSTLGSSYKREGNHTHSHRSHSSHNRLHKEPHYQDDYERSHMKDDWLERNERNRSEPDRINRYHEQQSTSQYERVRHREQSESSREDTRERTPYNYQKRRFPHTSESYEQSYKKQSTSQYERVRHREQSESSREDTRERTPSNPCQKRRFLHASESYGQSYKKHCKKYEKYTNA